MTDHSVADISSPTTNGRMSPSRNAAGTQPRSQTSSPFPPKTAAKTTPPPRHRRVAANPSQSRCHCRYSRCDHCQPLHHRATNPQRPKTSMVLPHPQNSSRPLKVPPRALQRNGREKGLDSKPTLLHFAPRTLRAANWQPATDHPNTNCRPTRRSSKPPRTHPCRWLI